jgi:hypothetical protein
VAFDDPLHNGEAHASPLVFIGAMEPLEHPEELIGMMHIEAGAIISDKVHRRAVRFRSAADLDGGGVSVARKLDRVAEQVRQDLL